MHEESGQRFLRGDLPPRRRVARRGWVRGMTAAAGLGAGLCGAVALYQGVARSRVLDVREIRVEGAVRADLQSLRQRLASLSGRSLLGVDLAAVRRTVSLEPWVKDASVERRFPGGIVVRIVERRPVAVDAATGQIVDDEGVIVAGSKAGEDDAALPRILGASKASEATLKSATALIATLATASVPLGPRVAAVDVADPADLRLVLAQSGRIVHLGRDGFVAKLNRYLNVEALVAERFPVATSLDLRFDGRVVVAPGP